MNRAGFLLLISLLSLGAPLSSAIPAGERTALVAFYRANAGDGWSDNSGWKRPPLAADGFALPGTENTWSGVTCDTANTTVQRLRYDVATLPEATPPDYHRLFHLPSELGDLSGLVELNLCGDTVSIWGDPDVPFPPRIAALPRLEVLVLRGCHLVGQVPRPANCANLTVLDLGYNPGLFPEELPDWLFDCTRLRELGLAVNYIQQMPEGIGRLQQLRRLDLHSCRFYSAAPASMANLVNLESLDLNSTYKLMDYRFPGWLTGMTRLRELDIAYNALRGPIPDGMANLTALEWLDMSGNHYSWAGAKVGFPAFVRSLPQLKHLDLSYCDLTGSLPSWLGELDALESLDLSVNSFSGPIPAGLGGVSSLQRLYLAFNELSGTLPAELGNLSRLVELDVSSNQLSGAIPAQWGDLAALEVMNFNGNRLSGAIPSELGRLSSLRTLILRWNALSGEVPASLANLENLEFFSLSFNSALRGAVLPLLTGLSKLWYLSLAYNQFSGELPAALCRLPRLSTLYLWGNRFFGELPANLGELPGEIVDLYDNQFSGALPERFLPVGAGYFYAGRNRLSGRLPADWGGPMGNYRYWDSNYDEPVLDLSANAFHGEVPHDIMRLTTPSQGVPVFSLAYNALQATDAGVANFVALHSYDHPWTDWQTVPPQSLACERTGTTSCRLEWTPISYTGDGGGYRVYSSLSPAGPFSLYGQTAGKSVASMDVTGLQSGLQYYFYVQTRTDPNNRNPNLVDSEGSGTVVLPGETIRLAITHPVEGQEVGDVAAVRATASYASGIQRLELCVDGAFRQQDAVAPYEFAWDTRTERQGSHVLLVRAVAANGVTAEAQVTVTVRNLEVAIDGLAEGAEVIGLVPFRAAVSYYGTVRWVEFYVDGALRFQDPEAPYGFNWDSRGQRQGSLELVARAVAANGVTAEARVTVTARNLVLTLSGELKQQSSWLSRRSYAELTAAVENLGGVAIAAYRIVVIPDGGGVQRILAVPAGEGSSWNRICLDAGRGDGIACSYRLEALTPGGAVLAQSGVLRL